MFLLNTQELFLILIFSTSCLTTSIFINGNESSESDDDSLKQALVLVDILKSEYLKSLRENAVPQEKENASSEEQSTCAPTTKGIINESQYNETIKYITIDNSSSLPFALPLKPTLSRGPTAFASISQSQSTSPAPNLPLQHLPLLPVYVQGSSTSTILQPQNPQIMDNVQWIPNRPQLLGERQINGGYRRIIPRDYYYYFDNPMGIYGNANNRQLPFFYRRMQNGDSRLQYEDPNWNNPNFVKVAKYTERVTTTVAPISLRKYNTTVAPLTSTHTLEDHETKRSNEKTQSNSDTATAATFVKSTTTPAGLKTKRVTKKIHSTRREKLKGTSNKKARVSNPILDQVAQELINEVGVAEDTTKRVSTVNNKHNIIKKLLRSNVMENNVKVNDKRTFSKTTIRVHMDRSTRLQLPLSENNAFCFLSPHSALCRSRYK